MEELLRNICLLQESDELLPLLNKLNSVIEDNDQLVDSITSELIDDEFINEIKSISAWGKVRVYFGKTLRDLKIVVSDEDGIRDHEIFLVYKSHRKLKITNVDLPNCTNTEREYSCLEEVVETFSRYISDLSRYFYELEFMDQCCSIKEPINATYKDEYRVILLDERVWLHVEVTPEGSARNIHLIGQSAYWDSKLQSGLLHWDHDKNIVENIKTIFDISTFLQPSTMVKTNEEDDNRDETLLCSICLCTELPGTTGVPQPLCQNTKCGVYYHRSCLYQWLVACSGSRPPAFGVANGACPTCLQPITCSENDN